MTILANVKGYINGAEWWVVEAWPSLLTYEEIVSMANTEWYPWTNTIAELNNYPENYYDMLDKWNHLYSNVDIWNKKRIKWISESELKFLHVISYGDNKTDWIWLQSDITW